MVFLVFAPSMGIELLRKGGTKPSVEGKDTKPACPEGMTVVQEHPPDKDVGDFMAANGCGPGGQALKNAIEGNTQTHLDGAHECCIAHDHNYNTCTNSQKDADDEYLNCLMRRCQDLEEERQREMCKSRSKNRYAAVNSKQGTRDKKLKVDTYCKCS